MTIKLKTFATRINLWLPLFLIPILATGQFSDTKNITGCKICNPSAMKTADIDGDGLLDIAISAVGDGAIYWSKNLGEGQYAQWVSFMVEGHTNQLYFEDLNGDGHVDLVYKVANSDRIIWYANDGNGNFQEQQITEQTSAGSTIFLVDIDEDDDLDIVVGAWTPEILYYQNDGKGNFQIETLLELGETDFGDKSVYLYDIDNDGDRDIQYVLYDSNFGDGDVFTLVNDGLGNYTDIKNIAGSRDGFFTLNTQFTDIEGDGDIDIVLPNFDRNQIAIFENDGMGNYPLNGKILSTTPFLSIRIGDVNEDGIKEILGYSSDGISINQIDGNKLSHPLLDSLNTRLLHFDDLDGDTTPELIIAENPPQLFWMELSTAGISDEKNYLNPNKLQGARMIKVADINRDGLNDIIFASQGDNKIGWYQNEGTTSFGVEQIISLNVLKPRSIYISDIDQDQDLDIISASMDDNKIAWYENSNNGTSWTERIISTNAEAAFSVFAIDLDQDGHIDILSSSLKDGKVAWYQNDTNNNFSAEIIISNSLIDPTFVYADDLDQDGDVDIIVADQGENVRSTPTVIGDSKFIWYENKGQAVFSEEQIIHEGSKGARSLHVADIDNDGFKDLVTASFNSPGEVIWHKNDGQQNFTSTEISSGEYGRPQVAQAVDFDGDGDLDILSASFQGELVWYQNDGSGGFSTEQIISDQIFGLLHAYAADIDQDGDSDIIFSSEAEYNISWVENLLDYPTIEGTIFWDKNNNGIREIEEPNISNAIAIIQPSALSSYTNTNGNFKFFVSDGDYMVIATNINDCWQLSTEAAFYQVSINGTVQRDLDFGYRLTSDFQHTQARISSAPTRCGFTVPFHISVQNDGCAPSQGQFGITLDSLVTFVDAPLPPTEVRGDTLLWNYKELINLETERVYINLQIAGTDFIGSTIQMTGLSYIQNETGQQELVSTYDYNSEIRCAYDPNDKLVTPQRASSRSSGFDQNYTLFEESLEYTIRFQNTGNDTAFQVLIEDQLDHHLDWSTFQPIVASHFFEVLLDNTGLLTFTFPDILLPDSTVNEPLSHGFITYKIAPKQNLVENTPIENTADIFFDFNPPITTNTTSNTMVSMLPVSTSLEEIKPAEQIRLYPNPFQNQLVVETKKWMDSKKYQLHFFDITGKLFEIHPIENTTIPTSNWHKGLYIYKLIDSNGSVIGNGKVVK